MPDDVNSGGDYSKDPSLEGRVSSIEGRLARLEAVVEEIRAELRAIRAELSELRLEVAEMRGEMRGRLSSLPTTFQLVFILAGFTVATFVGATGLSLTVLRLAGGH